MTEHHSDHFRSDEARAQAYILATYPERVAENKERLCRVCHFRKKEDTMTVSCDYALLPVTSKGEPCIYWREALAPPPPTQF